MWLIVAFILGGAAALYVGAEILVRGSVALALRLKISTLLIGLTLVAIGTSGPELFVNIRGAMEGRADLGVGNVIGANIVTIGGVLGLCALIKPLAISRQLVRWDMPAMLVTNIIMMVFTFSLQISRLKGAFFLGLFLLYLAGLYFITKKGILKEKEVLKEEEPVIEQSHAISRYAWWDLLLIGGGLILLSLGAQWLVKGAVQLAMQWGVSEKVIGLTVVAMGTSQPELITSIIAVFRKQHYIALGNIIGSNVYNLLGILGISSLVRPLQLEHSVLGDLLYLFLLQCFLFPILQKKSEISRWKGVCLLLLYTGFVTVLYSLK